MTANEEQRKLALELAVSGRSSRGATAQEVVEDAQWYADFLAGGNAAETRPAGPS